MKVKIGLETHVQILSNSKLFCGCATQGDEKPNTRVCPTCLGFPGSKPRVNEKVINHALKVALAFNCKINKETFFSRKTYFYPDMAKNFQISQYEIPLAEKGFLMLGNKKIRIKRIHIEEDPAKLVHIGGLGGKYVLVDYNRSGIPLIEIVTEPDFENPRQAREFVHKLETILEYLGVYDPLICTMRSDANISLEDGERVEVKNITGTKDIEKALNYEIVRQKNLILRGGSVERETRAWNSDLSVTQRLRGKEFEEDYGYIFEPDLTKIEFSRELIQKIKKELPELPEQKYLRFIKEYGISQKLSESLVSELDIANLFEEIARKINPKLAASWIAGPLKKTLNWNNLRWKNSGLKKEWILNLLKIFERGEITDRNTELTIRKMVEEKKPPEEIIKKYSFAKTKIKDLDETIDKILERNKQAVKDYKTGQKKALDFLIGQIIKETQGRIDPKEIREILKKKLAI